MESRCETFSTLYPALGIFGLARRAYPYVNPSETAPEPTPRSAPATTYGEHQEAAAAALDWLIMVDDLPAGDSDVEHLLQVRESAHSAVRDRLHSLGLSHPPMRRGTSSIASAFTLSEAGEQPTAMLAHILHDAPRLEPDRRARPTEVLARGDLHPTVEHWRRAAASLLAGSHALDASVDRPWLHDAGAGWYLVRDLAVTLEALVVLDVRLAEVGILSGLDGRRQSSSPEDHRLLAAQCARVATWYATSESPDLAIPERQAARQTIGPVQLVTRNADIAAAQRQLAGFLRPLRANDAFYTGEPAIAAALARMVVASQLLVVTYGEQLGRNQHRSQQPTAQPFTARREVLQELQGAMAYLTDVAPVPDNRRVIWQQSEITTAIRRLQRTPGTVPLKPHELLELAAATHETLHTAGIALRRELLRDSTNMRIADRTQRIGYTRIHRGHPLERCLTDLIALPAPSTPVARCHYPLHRAALRASLDLTPTASTPPPTPFPHAPSIPGPGR